MSVKERIINSIVYFLRMNFKSIDDAFKERNKLQLLLDAANKGAELYAKECDGKKQPDTESKLNIGVVVQQRELLINFLTFYMGDENSTLPTDMIEIVDIWIKN